MRVSFETFAALVTLKHLLQKNVKCRNLLENDAGGGSVSGSVAVSSCHTIVLFSLYFFFPVKLRMIVHGVVAVFGPEHRFENYPTII